MDEYKRKGSTVHLKVDQLHHHPDNPRKDIGDITELTESIRKNGIMQNLTVIPGYFEEDGTYIEHPVDLHSEYTVIIGHRRLEAAKAAGLTIVPCRIYTDLTLNEQISTMLEENMQRSDLTVFEQATTFQMMFDLGETEDTLAEKTGFSKATIRHRLNVAKLDQKLLKEKNDDEEFQLSFSDLYELEKVKNLDTRNKILKEARDSRDLKWRAHSEAKREILDEKEKEAVKIMKAAGLKEGDRTHNWNGDYECILDFDLRQDKAFKLSPQVKGKITEGSEYTLNYGSIKILRPIQKEKRELTEAEKERKEVDKLRKKFKDMQKALMRRTYDFTKEVVDGKLKDIDKEDIPYLIEQIIGWFLQFESYVSYHSIVAFISGREYYNLTREEKDDYAAQIMSYKFHFRLLMLMYQEMDNTGELMYYDTSYCDERGKKLIRAYGILELWGWSFTEEEKKLVYGTHEEYKPEEDPEDED